MSRWDELTGGTSGASYAARFAELDATGVDMHGEARFCASLIPAKARILDAGCGTGRVAIRLAADGHDCVGVDLDVSMLAEARRAAPEITWIQADLATLDLGDTDEFDLVVAAGNVIPLLAPGTESAAIGALAAVLRPGGLLVAGFGLDAAHLPVPPSVDLASYDLWCEAAGLTYERRFATWAGDEYHGDGYAVSVHRRSPYTHVEGG
jgi:Methylase involved in ubiquinone/menaquinone biosynthesis